MGPTRQIRVAAWCLLASGAIAPFALAQHARDLTMDRFKAVPGSMPRTPPTFAQCYASMRDAIDRLRLAVDSGNIEAAHLHADDAGDAAADLLAVARTPESRTPVAHAEAVERAAREVIAASDTLHDRADRNDLSGCGDAYVRMREGLAALTRIAPPEFACAMHCEGAKVYDAPGPCPVCKMDLKKVTSESFRVDVRPLNGTPNVGQPVELEFRVRDPRGVPVPTLKIVHEKPMHLLIVSGDLSWYAHEHPQPRADGSLRLSVTFPTPGTYTLFHDFTPPEVGQQVVPVAFTIPGPVPSPVALTPDANRAKSVDGYTLSLDTGGPVKTGDATTLRYTISRDGVPVQNLEPYLGAMGHLVLVSKDLASFVHSHPPMDAEGCGPPRKGPAIEFLSHFENPGLYKGWMQFKHAGRVVTVPFTIEVTGERVRLSPHTHEAPAKSVGPNSPFQFK